MMYLCEWLDAETILLVREGTNEAKRKDSNEILDHPLKVGRVFFHLEPVDARSGPYGFRGGIYCVFGSLYGPLPHSSTVSASP